MSEPTLDELQATLAPEELASAREAAAGLIIDALASARPGDADAGWRSYAGGLSWRSSLSL